MPHINIKMFPGRSEELKKEIADKLLKAAAEAIGCKEEALSVSINDVKKEDWNEAVAEKVAKEDIYSGEMYIAK